LDMLYLNTTWYIYLIVREFGVPKIARSLLKIGKSSDEVETQAIKIAGANDFSGTVEFDKTESYLIFNLKVKETGERGIHLKVDVNTGDRPEVILGQYQNIGIGGKYLHFSNVVLQYIQPEEIDSVYPTFFDSSDHDFSQVPKPIQLFLHDAKLNYAELPTRVFSLKSLQQYVDSLQSKQDSKPSFIRIRKDFKAFIAHPFGRLSVERGTDYRKAFFSIRDSLILKGIQVHEEQSHDLKMSLNSAFNTEKYLNWVVACDIFILLYFDEVVTNALNELAWAFQAGMPIIVLTSREPVLPSMYKANGLVTIIRFNNINESVSWLTSSFIQFLETRYNIEITPPEDQ
ncbi:MAG: hypothetical protein AAFO95_11325, partial [Cyanobacteria bacterium J06600_6]